MHESLCLILSTRKKSVLSLHLYSTLLTVFSPPLPQHPSQDLSLCGKLKFPHLRESVVFVIFLPIHVTHELVQSFFFFNFFEHTASEQISQEVRLGVWAPSPNKRSSSDKSFLYTPQVSIRSPLLPLSYNRYIVGWFSSLTPEWRVDVAVCDWCLGARSSSGCQGSSNVSGHWKMAFTGGSAYFVS